MVWLRIVLAMALGIPQLAAQGWRRPFQVLGPDQGLPAGSITSLTQDADGFIWVGTESALLRYEGGRSRRWGREEGLPSGFVHRVLPAAGGGIWAATLRGLVRVRDGRIQAAVLGPSPVPDAVALDRSGRLWALTRDGLFVEQDGLRFAQRAGRPAGRVLTLAGGPSGAVYLGAESGLCVFLPDGSEQAWGREHGLPASGVAQVAEDGAGRVWAGSGRSLAMKKAGARRFVDQSRRLKASLSPNSVPFLEADGTVWLPTQSGALHLSEAGDTWLDAAGGLPFRWVRTVFRDREGTLWILGTALARLQGRGQVWNHSLSPDASGEVVWSIHRQADGSLLAGTDNGAVKAGVADLARIPGTEGHRIKSLAADQAGTLWMASSLGPTLWLHRGGRRAVEAPLGDLGFAVNSVMADRQGRIWLGHTRLGVLRWDPGARRLVQEVAPPGPGPLGVFRIREDRGGRLWAASTAGLYLREPSGSWRLYGEKDGLKPFGLYGMAFLPDGSAWVHYQEPQGLTRVRIDQGRLEVLEQRVKGQGLRSDQVFAVDVDARGRTWATTDVGLDRVEPALHIGRQEGMTSEDCAIQALLAEGDRIWVGTAAGLVRYEVGPEHPATPPVAHIFQVLHGEQRSDPPFSALPPFPRDEATVAFRVAAPTFLDESEVRFQVRLLGLEDAWREADGHLIRYPALPGGHYRFEVRAAQGDGDWGPATGLDFQVRPPWWLTWWALALGGLAFLGLGVLILRLRVAALARGKAELEQLVARRTGELQARNTELSEALGKVKQLSGLLPICASCKKIRDDKGYWNQLEHYISAHSGADFTHGICPDCADALYPERRRAAVPKEPEPGT